MVCIRGCCPTSWDMTCSGDFNLTFTVLRRLYICYCIMYQSISVNSKPDHPHRATPGDSHIIVAPGVGFSLLSLEREFAWGILNQKKSSTILKKRDFCLVTKTND